ncbi:pyridoxal-dependent decarboxylase [Oerskovia sp. M15]
MQPLNALDPTTFSSVAVMERELVAFARNMLHGTGAQDASGVVGTVTSGGTESCLLAVKSARDAYLAAQPAQADGSPRTLATLGFALRVVAPTTVHAAFHKAAAYLGLELVLVPVDPDSCRAVPAALAEAVGDGHDVALVVVSAPSYPHGVVDPVEEIAAAASAVGSRSTWTRAWAGGSCPSGPTAPRRSRSSTSASRGHLDLGRRPQVRLRPQGHLGAADARPRPPASPAVRDDPLAGLPGRELHDHGLQVGGAARRGLGRDPGARGARLPGRDRALRGGHESAARSARFDRGAADRRGPCGAARGGRGGRVVARRSPGRPARVVGRGADERVRPPAPAGVHPARRLAPSAHDPLHGDPVTAGVVDELGPRSSRPRPWCGRARPDPSRCWQGCSRRSPGRRARRGDRRARFARLGDGLGAGAGRGAGKRGPRATAPGARTGPMAPLLALVEALPSGVSERLLVELIARLAEPVGR